MEVSLTMNELIHLTQAERDKLGEPPRTFKSSRSTVQNAPKPLDDFFTQCYPRFSFSATASPESQWRRLVRDQNWTRDSAEYNAARRRFEKVYDEQFNTSIAGFFNSYPDFEYNPRAEAKAEFERLRQCKLWFELPRKLGEAQYVMGVYRRARKDFFNAFVQDFAGFFGKGDDMRDWEYLCDVLGVKPTPKTIEGCKDALKGFYVNIYDLYDHVHRKVPLRRHRNVAALSKYSRDNNKLYPLHLAKTTCMKFLLREFESVPGYVWDDWKRELVPKSEREREGMIRSGADPGWSVTRNERSEIVRGQW